MELLTEFPGLTRIDEAQAFGCVVEFAVFAVAPEAVLDKKFHLRAARAISAFQELPEQEPADIFRDPNCAANIVLDEKAGKAIKVAEFLGSDGNLKTLGLKERPQSREVSGGFAYAFADPPYPLTCPFASADKLFQSLNKELFASFADPVRLFEWNAPQTEYFAMGREWWGTYLWTVSVSRRSQIIAVAASASD